MQTGQAPVLGRVTVSVMAERASKWEDPCIARIQAALAAAPHIKAVVVDRINNDHAPELLIDLPAGFSASASDLNQRAAEIRITGHSPLKPYVVDIARNAATACALEMRGFAIAFHSDLAAPDIINRSKRRLVLGVVSLAMFSVALFGFAVPLAQIRAGGVARQRSLMPVDHRVWLVSQVVSRGGIIVTYSAFLIAGADAILGLNLRHNTVSLFAGLMAITLMAIAYLAIAAVLVMWIDRTESVTLVANLTYFASAAFGGIFYSVESLPGWAAAITRNSPIRLAADLLEACLAEGATFAGGQRAAWLLALTAVIAMTLALLGPRRTV